MSELGTVSIKIVGDDTDFRSKLANARNMAASSPGHMGAPSSGGGYGPMMAAPATASQGEPGAALLALGSIMYDAKMLQSLQNLQPNSIQQSIPASVSSGIRPSEKSSSTIKNWSETLRRATGSVVGATRSMASSAMGGFGMGMVGGFDPEAWAAPGDPYHDAYTRAKSGLTPEEAAALGGSLPGETAKERQSRQFKAFMKNIHNPRGEFYAGGRADIGGMEISHERPFGGSGGGGGGGPGTGNPGGEEQNRGDDGVINAKLADKGLGNIARGLAVGGVFYTSLRLFGESLDAARRASVGVAGGFKTAEDAAKDFNKSLLTSIPGIGGALGSMYTAAVGGTEGTKEIQDMQIDYVERTRRSKAWAKISHMFPGSFQRRIGETTEEGTEALADLNEAQRQDRLKWQAIMAGKEPGFGTDVFSGAPVDFPMQQGVDHATAGFMGELPYAQWTRTQKAAESKAHWDWRTEMEKQQADMRGQQNDQTKSQEEINKANLQFVGGYGLNMPGHQGGTGQVVPLLKNIHKAVQQGNQINKQNNGFAGN